MRLNGAFCVHVPSKVPEGFAEGQGHREEDQGGAESSQKADEMREDGSATVKGLLEEVNKMLKSLTQTESSEASERGSRDQKKSSTLEALQKQINELKQKTIKLSRLAQDGAMGLVDSGATHPLGPTRHGEDINQMQKVQVTLASGEKTVLHMSKRGCMVTEDQSVEPIIPMGTLVGKEAE